MLRIIKANKVALLIALIAMAARLIFLLYVNRSWEDALINVLHAENFIEGLGLTHYHNGQPPTQGFSSPLNILIPILGEIFAPKFGLLFIKITSIVAGGFAVLYAYAVCKHKDINLPTPLAIIAATYVALEYQQILWGMSGLETQMAVLIFLMTIFYLLDFNEDQTWKLGVMLGLCMLARPDMMMFCMIAGIWVLFRSRNAFIKVTLWALLVYLPWILFATDYYGSFIPNTILAKEAGFGGLPLPQNWRDALRLDQILAIFAPLGPVFGGYGTGSQKIFNSNLITYMGLGFAIVGALVSLTKNSAVKCLTFFFLAYLIYYLYFVAIIFGWYLPTINVAAVILAMIGVNWVAQFINIKRKALILYTIAISYIAIIIFPLPLFFYTEKQIQINIEDGVRKNMGAYLGSVMQDTDKVALEPLGYVAYYSRRDVYDTPGLANRKVVDFYKSVPRDQRNLYQIVFHFKPEFVLLRPGNLTMEYGYFLDQPWFKTFYESDKEFKADSDQLEKMWRSSASYDTKFVVFKKRALTNLIGKEDWKISKGWKMIDAHEGISEAPIPLTYFAISEGNGLTDSLISKSIKLDGASKIGLYIKSNSVIQSEATLDIELSDSSGVIQKQPHLSNQWSLITFETKNLSSKISPITLAIKLNSTSKSLPIAVSEPFILTDHEKVKEFQN